jgi:hypothetical protein
VLLTADEQETSVGSTEPAEGAQLFDFRNGRGLKSLLREYLVSSGEGQLRNYVEMIIASLVKEAVNGNMRALHEVFERLDDGSESSRIPVYPEIDDATARRILEAHIEPADDPPIEPAHNPRVD